MPKASLRGKSGSFTKEALYRYGDTAMFRVLQKHHQTTTSSQ